MTLRVPIHWEKQDRAFPIVVKFVEHVTFVLEVLTKTTRSATFVVVFQAESEKEGRHLVDAERRLRRNHKRPEVLRRRQPTCGVITSRRHVSNRRSVQPRVGGSVRCISTTVVTARPHRDYLKKGTDPFRSEPLSPGEGQTLFQIASKFCEGFLEAST